MRLNFTTQVGHTATATFVYHAPIVRGKSNAVIQQETNITGHFPNAVVSAWVELN
jgi:hypothetical protein